MPLKLKNFFRMPGGTPTVKKHVIHTSQFKFKHTYGIPTIKLSFYATKCVTFLANREPTFCKILADSILICKF